MKSKLKNILVPIDFQKSSLEAFQYALSIAKRIEGNIILLSILETKGVLADMLTSGVDLVKVSVEIKDKLQDLTNSLARKYEGVDISSKVLRGKPYEKILECAVEVDARMIILGENHQGSNENQQLGSTVFQVTLKSPVPVLTIKGSIHSMNERMVVPLDLTHQTRKQLFSAISYGINYNTEVHLVSALVGGIKVRDSRIFKKLKQAKETIEDNRVKCIVKLFKRSDIPPYKRVLEYAEAVNAGFILVLTHQEGYTYDNYIGAFAHHVINESTVPVLSLNSQSTNIQYSDLLTDIVDPAGLLRNRS